MRSTGSLAAAAAAALLLGGCVHTPVQLPPTAILEMIPAGEWPVLADDLNPESLAAACRHSVEYLERLPPDLVLSFGPVERSAAELARGTSHACEIVTGALVGEEWNSVLQNEFLLLRSVGRNGRGEVLFTGYYEPLLDAREEASES